ncbi:peptidoglycan-binding protein LysM [Gelidibacter japonicus]|uniref:peptidoglycan-binding protein LysM n=1 Tax=Gelidibacter japonicus TaxID=1962232 RepID=UPI0013D67B43|nr:peptidoglycan-binding protein LysM [Gelidibacter japonicus]MCL8008589.1 peptidoglycan-binding protein LysM [Gelidibacter japonicus]
MGLFSFIKNAGAKVFGVGNTDAEEKAEAQANANRKAAANELNAKEAGARKLEETIRDLKLEVEDLKIKIDDDMAIVKGKAYDQSTREKVVLVIGNTNGIASVDDQMSVEHAEPEAQFHTVIKGDTLGKIAKKYYGNAMKYPIIFEANKPMLTDPDKIYPGQVLRIPSLA